MLGSKLPAGYSSILSLLAGQWSEGGIEERLSWPLLTTAVF